MHNYNVAKPAFGTTLWNYTSFEDAYAYLVASSRSVDYCQPAAHYTSGISLYPGGSVALPEDEALELMLERLSSDEVTLNGTAEAIPVMGVEPTEVWEFSVSMNLELPGEMARDEKQLKERILRELQENPDAYTKNLGHCADRIDSLTTENIADVNVSHHIFKTTDVRTTTERPVGELETRYFVVPVKKKRPIPAWDTGYATQKEAEENLPEKLFRHFDLMAGGDWQISQTHEVISMTRRVGGAGLTRHVVDTVKSSVVLNAHIQIVTHPRTVRSDIKGWLIYGKADTNPAPTQPVHAVRPGRCHREAFSHIQD